MAMGMHTFASGNDHRLPPAAICDRKTGKPLLSWRVAILPYIEHEALFKEFKLDQPWDSPHNLKLLPRMPKIYAEPGGEVGSTTIYRVLVGKGTAFEPLGQRKPPFGEVGLSFPDDFPDGTANTLLIVEAADAVAWTRPDELVYDPKGPLPRLRDAKDGPNVALTDGSVRALPRSLDEATLRALITRNDGRSIKLP
jgi:hypothetical protein